MNRIDSRGYVLIRGVTLAGARLHVHVVAIAVAAGMLFLWRRQPVLALEAVASYAGMILLHEMGHAAMARRLGWRPSAIYLGVLHGRCDIDAPDNRRDEALVAWGGVLAQFAVALPLVALAQLPAFDAIAWARIPVATLGYISLFVALLNLAPARGMDGATAWQLLPILRAERRRSAAAKKATRELMQRLK